MPLPDYSKKKADLKRQSHQSTSNNHGIRSLEATLNSLPDDGDNNNRRRSSGGMAYDMGINLEVEHNRNDPMQDVSQLEDSMASLQPDALADPFYDEEESVTEHYDEDEDTGDSFPRRNFRGSMSRSVNDVHVRLPDNPDRRPSGRMNKSLTDLSDKQQQQQQYKHNPKSGKLQNFLENPNRRGRKTNLLPGSTTEDLTSEMNEVVSMLSAKRSGTNRSRSKSSAEGPTPRLPPNESRRLRADGSSRRRSSKSPGGDSTDNKAERRRTNPRRSQSHDCNNTTNNNNNNPKSPRGLPGKSRSADGSSAGRRIPGRTSSGDKHTSSSFVTGSRIRRIQPGGGRSGSHDLGASSSSLQRQQQRSISPKRRPLRKESGGGGGVKDDEIPMLITTK